MSKPEYRFRQRCRPGAVVLGTEVTVERRPALYGSALLEPLAATVLNVNDDDDNRHLDTLRLTRAGFEVVEAATGEEALLLAADSPPDLVLLDVSLPGMDGFEVCRRLKADPATAATPVLMLSGAFVSPGDRVRGLEGGADGYLTAPLDPAEMVAWVRAVLRLHRAESRGRAARAEADRAVADLRASEERFRLLADALPQIVWAAGPDGRTDYLNERWYEYTGLHPDSCAGQGWWEALHPDDKGPCREALDEAVRSGRPCQVEGRLMGRSGSHRWHLGRALPVRFGSGEVTRWFGTWTDIDDQKRAEDRLGGRSPSGRPSFPGRPRPCGAARPCSRGCSSSPPTPSS